MNLNRLLLLSCATGALVGMGGVAAAQDQTTVEEIVVTATKRSESLQEVPVAVTAFTAAVREETGIVTTQDQMNFTPGVSYSATADRVAIRGVGRQTNQIGTDPGVAVYQDGFYVPSLAGVGGSTLGVARVEILRGPQGTLYGRNSIGGAINVISRRPSDQFEGEVRLGYNDYGRTTVEGRVAGPLTDNVRGSLMVLKADQEDGYFENIAGGPDEGGVVDILSGEAQLAVDFNERFDMWMRLTGAGANNRDRADNMISPYDAGYSLENIPTPTFGLDPMSNPGASDPRKFATNRPASQDIDDNITFVTEWNYRFDSVDLKYIGGYQQYNLLSSIDGDRSARAAGMQYPLAFPTTAAEMSAYLGTGFQYDPTNPLFDSDTTTAGVQPFFITTFVNDIQTGAHENKDAWSHELNFSSNGSGPLQWLFGLYHYQERIAQGFNISMPNEPGLDNPLTVGVFPAIIGPLGLLGTSGAVLLSPPGSLNVNPNPLRDGYRYETALDTRSSAAFAQFDYDFTDTLHGTFGIRYSHDEKEGYEWSRIPPLIPFGVATGVDPDGGGPLGPLAAPLPIYFAYDISLIGACPLTLDCGDPAFAALLGGPAQRRVEDSWNATTGTLGLQWTPSDDTMVYGSYSRGYKSGGFNLGTFAPDPTEQETVDAFELGWKQSFGASFQLNSALFHYIYEGMQVPYTIKPAPGVAVPVLENVEEATTTGVEFEAIWSPTDNFRVMANYSYLNAELTKACCLVDAANPTGTLYSPDITGFDAAGQALQRLDGNAVPFSPEHKVAVNATYRFNFEPGSLSLSATGNYRTESYYTVFNTPDYEMDGYDTWDFRAMWNDANDRYSIIGSVTNAFDEEAVQSFSTSSPQTSRQQTIGLQPPRIVSVEFQYRF